MPLQNRVTPDGELVATAARGTIFGNRGGCFHRPDGTLRPRHWANRQWICCVLEFKNRRRTLLQPGLYTELFFLDEATAFAAGHRPCFECRRADARQFAALWAKAHALDATPSAPAMDVTLHAERLADDGRKRTAVRPLASLPDGAIIRYQDAPSSGARHETFAVARGGLRNTDPPPGAHHRHTADTAGDRRHTSGRIPSNSAPDRRRFLSNPHSRGNLIS